MLLSCSILFTAYSINEFEIVIPQDLLKGDIDSVLTKVKKTINSDTKPFLLWTSEVCRHFGILFFIIIIIMVYRQMEIKRPWSHQTVYRTLDVFKELTSGVSL